MRVFIDTSAFYALLDRSDENHLEAKREGNRLLDEDRTLVTSNYILIETVGLLQNRLGMSAVRGFQKIFIPFLTWNSLPRKHIAWGRQPCWRHPGGG